MDQMIICKVPNCAYRSKSGFCLNRLTVINEQGVCNWLTKPGWDQQIREEWRKNTWRPVQEEEKEEEPLLLEESQEKRITVEDLLKGDSEDSESNSKKE